MLPVAIPEPDEQPSKFKFEIDHAELINMKKKTMSLGQVVETEDPEYALGITFEHSLVAQQYLSEKCHVTFCSEFAKQKYSKKDSFTVSFAKVDPLAGLLREGRYRAQ